MSKIQSLLVVIEIDGTCTWLRAYRLDDNGSCAASHSLVVFEIIFEHVEVVRSYLVYDREYIIWYSVRFKELSRARHFKTVDHLIRPAVVCSADLDNSLVLSLTSCDTYRSHDRLRTRAKHSEHLDVGHILVDFLCDKEFCLVEKTCDRTALLDKLDSLFLHVGIVAAQDSRTACLQEVDILVAVDIGEICALSLHHAHWEWLVERQIMLNAAWYIFLCLRSDLLWTCAFFVIIFRTYLFIFFLWNRINILIRKVSKTLFDLLCVSPASDAVTLGNLLG